MANIFTPTLGLTKQITGENPDGLWGDTLNTGFMDLADVAIAGRTDIDVASGNVTLTSTQGAANQSRSMFLHVTGSPGAAREVIVPSVQKLYIVSNESDSDVEIKTVLNAGVTLASGARRAVFVDAVLDLVTLIDSGNANAIAPGPIAAADIIAQTNQAASIEDRTSGFAISSLNWYVQGSFAMVDLPISNALVVVASTSYRIIPTVSPFLIRPTFDTDFYCWIVENSSYHECYLRVYSDGTAMEFFKCDGSAWINGSSRSTNHVIAGGADVVFSRL